MKTLLLTSLLLAFSLSTIAQSGLEITNLISETIKYNSCEKVYLKRVNANSILLFFQSKTDDVKYFKRSILIESKEDLTSVIFPLGASFDVVIPQSQKFIAFCSKNGEQSFLFGLYDAHESLHAINAKLTGKKPTIIFGYGISYMQNIWDKDNAMKSKKDKAIAVLIDANTNISETDKQSLQASLAAPGGTTCNSGGVGSSSCSVEQGFPTTQVCSVSCNAGYYACCNTTSFTCTCKANPKAN